MLSQKQFYYILIALINQKDANPGNKRNRKAMHQLKKGLTRVRNPDNIKLQIPDFYR